MSDELTSPNERHSSTNCQKNESHHAEYDRDRDLWSIDDSRAEKQIVRGRDPTASYDTTKRVRSSHYSRVASTWPANLFGGLPDMALINSGQAGPPCKPHGLLAKLADVVLTLRRS